MGTEGACVYGKGFRVVNTIFERVIMFRKILEREILKVLKSREGKDVIKSIFNDLLIQAKNKKSLRG